MHLVFCVDGGYAMPLAVTLKSIERSQADPSALQISVFTAGFSAGAEEAVRRSVPELALEFIDIDRHLPRDLPQMRWFTRATYGRLVVPTLIGRIGRVIYLDADLIVRDVLGFLHSQDLHGNVIAAVRSMSVPHVSDPFGLTQWEELGLPATPGSPTHPACSRARPLSLAAAAPPPEPATV